MTKRMCLTKKINLLAKQAFKSRSTQFINRTLHYLGILTPTTTHTTPRLMICGFEVGGELESNIRWTVWSHTFLPLSWAACRFSTTHCHGCWLLLPAPCWRKGLLRGEDFLVSSRKETEEAIRHSTDLPRDEEEMRRQDISPRTNTDPEKVMPKVSISQLMATYRNTPASTAIIKRGTWDQHAAAPNISLTSCRPSPWLMTEQEGETYQWQERRFSRNQEATCKSMKQYKWNKGAQHPQEWNQLRDVKPREGNTAGTYSCKLLCAVAIFLGWNFFLKGSRDG